MYCSLIGDIIDSRILASRGEVQKKLSDILVQLNDEYKNNIKAKLTITIGDEFQGLFSSTNSVLKIIKYIKLNMYPVKFRFGVGIGSIETDIVSEFAIGADGPAYHNAREALDEIKLSKTKYSQPVQDTKIQMKSYDSQANISLINAGLSACALIESSWTEKQRDVINLMQKEKISQRGLAEKLNMQPAAIQKRLAGSDYVTYKYIADSVESAVNDLWEKVKYE